jgi:aerobic carbon-monoxide dehydrogenase medium subunit
VKPAAFAYLAPRTVEEAVDQLAEHGQEARVLAGGQSLVRLMNTRLATPSVVIDINRIPGLDGIDTENGAVRIGAGARQRSSELSPLVRSRIPLFVEAGALVAHASVRRRGTVVGSVAFADPSAELPAALLALDGQVVARSARGERVIEADDFFVGPFENGLAADELAVELRIPVTSAARTGSAFVEVARRHGDLPMCGAGTVLQLDESGAVTSARIALCAVDRRPVRARTAEAALVGNPPTDDLLGQAAELAAAGADPIGDCHGSASFRRHLARVITRRSLAAALARARQEDTDA